MKKFTHVFLAAILAFASLISLVPQPVEAQESTRVVLIRQFNSRTALFDRVMLRAMGTLDEGRIFLITSGLLGIPVDSLRIEFQNSGLGLNHFVVAVILARSAGVPVALVINELHNMNLNFGRVALRFNLLVRPVLFRIDGFTNILADEIAIIRGGGTIDLADLISDCDAALERLNNRVTNVSLLIEDDVRFRAVLFRTLALETGMTVDQISSLRELLPADMSPGDFAVFILARTSLGFFGSDILSGFDTVTGGRIVVVTPDLLVTWFSDAGVPLPAFTIRIHYFQRRFVTEAEQV